MQRLPSGYDLRSKSFSLRAEGIFDAMNDVLQAIATILSLVNPFVCAAMFNSDVGKGPAHEACRRH